MRKECNEIASFRWIFVKTEELKMAKKSSKQAMEQFKMEAAREMGVDLSKNYNGDITSKQAGSVGGQMVKKMIEEYENKMK